MDNNTKINFTPFTPNQIEVRPTNTKIKGKCSLLLYIDSRAVGKILNDTFGNFNWQIDYKNLGDKLYGTLSIWDNTKQQWVGKTDTGSATTIEADKGQASDILKRCLARWGADFLYSSPDITIKCPDSYYYNDKLFMSFRVQEIGYDDNKKINHLIIVDKFGNVVFNMNNESKTTPINTTPSQSTPTNNTTTSSSTTLEQLNQFYLETEPKDDKLKKFYRYYKDKIENNKWKGSTMDINALWEKWKE